MRWRASRQWVFGTCIGPLMLAASLDAAAQLPAADVTQPVIAPKPALESQPVVLKYRFEADQTVHYIVSHKMIIRSQKGRATQTAKSDWTTYKHLRVIKIDPDETATVETTIDRVEAVVQFDDEPPHKYDSSVDKTAPAPLRRVSESIGKPLAHTRFTTDGRLISTVSLLGAAAGPLADSEAASDDPSRKNFLITLPAGPVRIGESWKDSFVVKVSVPPKLQRNITLSRKYTLLTLENGLATIQLQTSVLTPVNNPEIEAQLIQRPQQGEILFDVAKGLIVSRTLRVNQEVSAFAGPNSTMKAESTLIETLASQTAVASESASQIEPVPPTR